MAHHGELTVGTVGTVGTGRSICTLQYIVIETES
jgi:hypothetical protein